MVPGIYIAHIRWNPVPGATGYQIAVNGVNVSKAGPLARTSKLSVKEKTRIEVTALPTTLGVVQVVDFEQVAV